MRGGFLGISPFLGALPLFLCAPKALWPALALGVGLLLLGRRLYPGAFLWGAFLPGAWGFWAKPLALWLPDWAFASGLLLLYGLFLSWGRWGSLFLLPPALYLGPLGLFLLGIVHGAVLLEEERRRSAERGEAFQAPPRALLLPPLLGLALGGLAFLPHPAPFFPLPAWTGPGLEARGQAPEALGEGVVYGRPEGGLSPWALWVDRALAYAWPLTLALLLLVLLSLLGRGGRLPYRGSHLLPVLLALLAFGLLFLYLGTLGGGEVGASPGAPSSPVPPAPEPGPREVVPGPRRLAETGLALAGLSALATLALLLGLGLFLWRGRLQGREGVQDPRPRKEPRAFRKPLPEDRVRRAYALALRALKGKGFPHLPQEGPLEYLGRLWGLWPEAAPFLEGLTRLYLPVRYGGRTGEGAAEEAEAHLEAIFKLCSTSASKRP
ncbi:hypothetical protein FJNA_24140 [Thermus sp. FJN-A]